MEKQKSTSSLKKLMLLTSINVTTDSPTAGRKDIWTPTQRKRVSPQFTHMPMTPQQGANTTLSHSKIIYYSTLTPKEKSTRLNESSLTRSPTLRQSPEESPIRLQKFEKSHVVSPKRVIKVSKSKLESLIGIQSPTNRPNKTMQNLNFSVNGKSFLPHGFSKQKINLHPQSTTSILSRNNLETSQDQSSSRIIDLLQKSSVNSPKARTQVVQTEESFLKNLIIEEDHKTESANKVEAKIPSIREWDHNYTPIYQRLELQLNQQSPTSPKVEKAVASKCDSQAVLSKTPPRLNSTIFLERSRFTSPRSNIRAINLRFIRTPDDKTTRDVTPDFPSEKVFC